MNKKNEMKKNNKGFSLVELIVVIAIMVVLVAVLAPTFTKYVEQSRRATDVQNANSIAEAVLADAADGALAKDTTFTVTDTTITGVVSASHPSAIAKVPAVKGTFYSDATGFSFSYSKANNECEVYICDKDGGALSGNLADETAATTYKNAK